MAKLSTGTGQDRQDIPLPVVAVGELTTGQGQYLALSMKYNQPRCKIGEYGPYFWWACTIPTQANATGSLLINQEEVESLLLAGVTNGSLVHVAQTKQGRSERLGIKPGGVEGPMVVRDRGAVENMVNPLLAKAYADANQTPPTQSAQPAQNGGGTSGTTTTRSTTTTTQNSMGAMSLDKQYVPLTDVECSVFVEIFADQYKLWALAYQRAEQIRKELGLKLPADDVRESVTSGVIETHRKTKDPHGWQIVEPIVPEAPPDPTGLTVAERVAAFVAFVVENAQLGPSEIRPKMIEKLVELDPRIENEHHLMGVLKEKLGYKSMPTPKHMDLLTDFAQEVFTYSDYRNDGFTSRDALIMVHRTTNRPFNLMKFDVADPTKDKIELSEEELKELETASAAS